MEVKMVISGSSISSLVRNLNKALTMIRNGKREVEEEEFKFSFSSRISNYTFSEKQRKELDTQYKTQMDNYESASLNLYQVTNNEKTDYSNVTIGDVDRVENGMLILKSKL